MQSSEPNQTPQGPNGGQATNAPSSPGQPSRRILHLDVDSFLASVEQACFPELRGRPVVVGGMPTERNLVMSCSGEARRFGIRPGLRLSEAAKLCPQAIFRRGDSQAANRLRERLALQLVRFSPLVEVASIDDFFVDLTGTARLHGSPFQVANSIRTRVWQELHLPLSIGIGSNRMMARLAGKLAKPGGIAEIFSGGERAFLRHLPVRQLPGVGHSIGRHLDRFAIRTVGDLWKVSRELLFASFGTPGLILFERSRGIDAQAIEPSYQLDAQGQLRIRPPKSIRRDSTFEPEEGRRDLHEAMLSYLVERSTHRLRSHGLAAGSIEVRVRYVDTRTPKQRRAHPEHSPSFHKRRSLPESSTSTDVIWRAARQLLSELPRRRALLKRIGISLLQLHLREGWQGQLFAEATPGSEFARHELDQAIDQLRAKHGFGGLMRGSSLPLLDTHRWTKEGFPLRTPSLNQ